MMPVVGPGIDVEPLSNGKGGGGGLSVLTPAEVPKRQSERRARINLLDQRTQVGEGFEKMRTSARGVACAS
jgi:hypothetical protein